MSSRPERRGGSAGRRRRNVDEEDEPPAHLDEQAADHGASGKAGRGNRPVHPEGVAALLFVGPARDEQGKPCRSQHRGTEPLDSSRGDQQTRLDRQASRDAGKDEDAEPDPVQPGPAENVSEPAAEEEEAAERDGTSAHQPL